MQSDEIVAVYPPYRIYNQLQALCAARRLELSGTPLAYDAFVQSIKREGYVLLEARDMPTKDRRWPRGIDGATRSRAVVTLFLLLDPQSRYAENTAGFTSLFNKIPALKAATRAENIDLLVISEEDLGPHITKKMTALQQVGDADNGFLVINAYQYEYFSSNRLEYDGYFPHRLLSLDEERRVETEMRKAKKDFPKIRRTDVISVWHGFETGDMIEVQRPSELSGIAVEYLHVV